MASVRRNMQGLVFQLEYIVCLWQFSFVFDIIFFTALKKCYFLELGHDEHQNTSEAVSKFYQMQDTNLH